MDTHSLNKISLLQELDIKLNSRTVVLGIGNVLRSDDGFGALLANRLKDKVDLKVFEAGSAPENYLGTIIRENPSTVLFVDAVDFGGNVAEVRLIELKDVSSKSFFSTHNHTLDFLCSFLKANTRANLYLLAVQPQNLSLGEIMNRKIQERMVELEQWFKESYPLKTKE